MQTVTLPAVLSGLALSVDSNRFTTSFHKKSLGFSTPLVRNRGFVTHLCLLFAILLVSCGLAHATTVQRLSLEDMTKKAGSIAVVRVKNARSYWQGKLILTTYSMDVQETIKGLPSRSIEITTVGGTVGDATLHVAGMPVFQPGEDAVVFVERSGAFSTVVGLSQGKFTLDNGQVANSMTGLSFPDGNPGRRLTMPLNTFKQQLRLILDRQAQP